MINTEIPPLDENGNFKHKFQVMMKTLGTEAKDGMEKAIFVDNEKLDFKIDIIEFLEAKNRGPEALIKEQKRIEKDFINSVSEAIGRKVTAEEIKKATVEGWI